MIKNQYLVIILFLAILVACDKKEVIEINDFKIIPLPNDIKLHDGYFLLDNHTLLNYDKNNEGLKSIDNYFSTYLKNFHEIDLGKKKKNRTSISLKISNEIRNEEAYELTIDSTGIQIIAKSEAGIFYGVQSVIQMLPANTHEAEGFKLPFCQISDQPQFKWRGLNLDVCRHFFPVEFVKKMIDMAARLKLNTFHWHLTEDQGWRIEIKKYPKLTEIGAWRKETLIGHAIEHPSKYDKKKHGGFYTQEQIKEVVEYAQKRFVTIVPEIEMPGHSVAALAAYPEYSCTGGPFEVATTWGVFNDVYCAGKEETFQFLEDILTEVIDLFPGEYIHIGGDECPKSRWKECPDCQKRIKTEKLKNEYELQSYFIKRIEKFLNSKGKKIIGWDEILEGGLADGAAVMSWRGELGGIEAAMSKHYVVMSPNATNYFDHYQGKINEPLAIGGLTTLKDAYMYQPVPEALDSTFHKYILGSQANLWTEYIPTGEHAEYMLFPRLCALAENLWTKSDKHNWEDFIERMDQFYPYLDQWGVNYRVNPPEGFEEVNRTTDDEIVLELKNDIPSSKIYYTFDGTEPNTESNEYSEPINLQLDSTILLKTASFLPSEKKSQTVTATFEKLKYFTPLKVKNYGMGVSYLYYEGEYSSAKKIDDLEIYNGVVSNIRLPEDRTDSFFAVTYSGYLKIPSDDVYNFYLTCDDGAILYIQDYPVVDNDNFQWATTKSGKVALKEGLHPFKLKYFQAKYGHYLNLQVESGTMEKQRIPDNWLWH